MPIYPAREEPIPGVTSDELMKAISTDCLLLNPAEVLEWSKTVKEGIILTIGAGDIDRLVPQLTNQFKTNLR